MGSGPRRRNVSPAFQVDFGTWQAFRTCVNLAILCKSCTRFDSRKAPKTCQGCVRLAVTLPAADRQWKRVGHLTGPRVPSVEPAWTT
jgi:hypothetical protein